MISTRALLLMALISTLFTAGSIVVEHQAFAAHHSPHKGSSDFFTLTTWAESATVLASKENSRIRFA